MNAHTRNAVAVRGQKGHDKKAGRHGRTDIPNMIERSWEDLGSVRVELEEFRFAHHIDEKGPNTWRRVPLGGKKPQKLVLHVDWVLKDDVEILYAFKHKVLDGSAESDKVPVFEIPITWKPGPKRDSDDVPVLPPKGERDFQLYLINKKTGFIVHVDVTIVSRKGTFWLVMQEVTGGIVVQHDPKVELNGYTSVVLGDYAYSVVPFFDENCYPGFDPVASWNRADAARADKVLGYAVDFGAYVPAEDAVVGVWEPKFPEEVPAALAAKGYVAAVAMWFNLTGGYGFLMFKDGMTCFVHFTAIQDENGKSVADQGDFPVLQPMDTGYYVKWKMDTAPGSSELKPRATAVRPAPAQAA